MFIYPPVHEHSPASNGKSVGEGNKRPPKVRTECVPHHLASRILTINGIQYTPASNNPSAVT